MMKVKFRTVLLVFLFIKLCILFTVLQETIESLNSDDHPLLFGTNDIYLFDLTLATIATLSIFISGFLIILFAIGHTRLRKPYIIVAFIINLLFVVPFFCSGIYLTFQDDLGLQMKPDVDESFGAMINFTEKYYEIASQMKNNMTSATNSSSLSSITSAILVNMSVEPDEMRQFEVVEHIQKRYCCCGLSGASDYGFDDIDEAPKMSIRFTSKLNIKCPHNSLFKNSTCVDSHLKGCETRLKTVYPTRILIYSAIGSVFSIAFALLTPLIYSQFELDRRRARSQYIRNWRHSLETYVNDYRMWSLRNPQNKKETPPQVDEVKQSPVSPAIFTNQSTKSKNRKLRKMKVEF
uniref:Tetraspanin n=1 Tax=Caenorhabditis tropicalis TaxID=1561998 RepID=A0A1I7TFG3_9PELO